MKFHENEELIRRDGKSESMDLGNSDVHVKAVQDKDRKEEDETGGGNEAGSGSGGIGTTACCSHVTDLCTSCVALLSRASTQTTGATPHRQIVDLAVSSGCCSPADIGRCSVLDRATSRDEGIQSSRIELLLEALLREFTCSRTLSASSSPEPLQQQSKTRRVLSSCAEHRTHSNVTSPVDPLTHSVAMGYGVHHPSLRAACGGSSFCTSVPHNKVSVTTPPVVGNSAITGCSTPIICPYCTSLFHSTIPSSSPFTVSMSAGTKGSDHALSGGGHIMCTCGGLVPTHAPMPPSVHTTPPVAPTTHTMHHFYPSTNYHSHPCHAHLVSSSAGTNSSTPTTYHPTVHPAYVAAVYTPHALPSASCCTCTAGLRTLLANENRSNSRMATAIRTP